MANKFDLEVTKRDNLDKSNIKKLREDGKIPGVYYSHDSKESISLYIDSKELSRAQKADTRIFNINVGNKKRESGEKNLN